MKGVIGEGRSAARSTQRRGSQTLPAMAGVCALALSWTTAAPGPATAQTPVPTLAVEAAALPNGLRVLVSTDRSAPLVAVNLRYGVGSGHEPEGRTGFAHLFEHLMFEATENLADGELERMITEAGGVLNGRTNVDRTEYVELVPSHHLNRVLWSHAERMRRLVVSEESFERQREIVKEERRLRVDNAPYGVAQIAIDTLTQDYAPYGHSVIGSMADLEAASVDDVRDFYDRWYRPSNATLVVVGDATMDDVLPWVERYFGEFESGPAPEPLPPPPTDPRRDGPRRLVLEDRLARLPLVYVAWSAPPDGHPDLAPLVVANQLLATGESSRIYRTLVAERRVATQVVGQVATRYGPGLFLTGALSAPGGDPEAVEAALIEVVEELVRDGPTAAEVEKAVNQLRVARVAELLTVTGKAAAIHRAAVVEGDPEAIGLEFERLSEVTPEQVRTAAARWLRAGNRNVVVAGPTGGWP